jgi:hypothetical protein
MSSALCAVHSTPTDESDPVNMAFGNKLEVEYSLITNIGIWGDVPFNALKFIFIVGSEL